MSTVLIVDDEPAICWALDQALSDCGHRVLTVSTGKDALELADRDQPDVVLMDVRLPGDDGVTVMKQFHSRYSKTPVIVMTAFGNLETAIDAVSHGAYEYLTKPFDLDDAVDVIRRALGRARKEVATAVESAVIETTSGFMLGTSRSMQAIFRQIALVADRNVPVLITGESGTGKELIATAIHRYGARSQGPFVPICVPAMSEHLVESELFGHVRGAFTGAESERRGLLMQADSGTAFFDEIGDIAAATQVKLLRVLETKTVTPVGSNQSMSTDFRLVAATNRDVERMVSKGLLREDLYYRLNVFRIEVPPLRDRKEDIPLLAMHFLRRMEGCSEFEISAAAMDLLLERPWHGNVRELKNVIESASIEARSGVVEPHDIPAPITTQDTGETSQYSLSQATESWLSEYMGGRPLDQIPEGINEKFLRETEPIMLKYALKVTSGNRQEAARLLGMHRQTLREKLRKYDLDNS